MDPELGTIKKTYDIPWENLLNKLLIALQSMTIDSGIWGGMVYGYRKKVDGSPIRINYEPFPGFKYTDQKVVFFAKKNITMGRDKFISIILYHNIHGRTLLMISESDPSLGYGYQKLMAHSGYIKFFKKIFQRLEQEI